MSDAIGIIPKNKRERIEVSFGSYEGHDFLDIRVHYLKPDETFAPTQKGVTVKLQHIGNMVELLQRAKADAEARGLIGGDA